VQSKSDYPYFVATGILDEESREEGRARIEAVLATHGCEVLDSGHVDYFLGSCVHARRGEMVVRASVGWSTSTGFNPYPRLPGRVYVQASVGHEGSNQGCTQLDGPDC
jgi:hypothetical protein